MDLARSPEVPWGGEALRRKFCVYSEDFFSMFGWRGKWDGAPAAEVGGVWIVAPTAGEVGAERERGTPRLCLRPSLGCFVMISVEWF